VDAEAGRYADTVRAVAGATGAFEMLTAAKFAQLTTPLVDIHLAGATSIVYLVPASDGEIPAVEALWRGRGVPGLRLQASGAAREYTLPGQPARIDIAAHPDDGLVRVQIADRGIGIPADEQPHVFNTFHRSAAHDNYSGTGLGLAICHRVVERHGGTIAVSDNPGGGTRVTFTLPAADPAAPSGIASTEALCPDTVAQHG
jgi:hypothetical protein